MKIWLVFLEATRKRGANYVWSHNSCSFQCNLGTDKTGWDVSSAMGVWSQVGNVPNSRFCIYVCVLRCWGWVGWKMVHVCATVWNIWASFWSAQVDSVVTAALLPSLSFRETRGAWQVENPSWSTAPPPQYISPNACLLFLLACVLYTNKTTYPQSCLIWADEPAPKVDKCWHTGISLWSPFCQQWLDRRNSFNGCLYMWLKRECVLSKGWGRSGQEKRANTKVLSYLSKKQEDFLQDLICSK